MTLPSNEEMREKIIQIIGPRDEVSIAQILNIITVLIDVLAEDYNLPIGHILKIGNKFIDKVKKMIKKEKKNSK